jgi:hypothetical protein
MMLVEKKARAKADMCRNKSTSRGMPRCETRRTEAIQQPTRKCHPDRQEKRADHPYDLAKETHEPG